MKIGNILLEQQILLESGTNELEILVFRLAEYSFGINVAKVREVLPMPKITSLPKAHSSVMGVFRLRERVIPCVSLRKHLGCPERAADAPQTLILADFNQQQSAFVVDQVERIHRLSWEQILSMPSLEALSSTPVTAIARIEGRLVTLLDFEMIAGQISTDFYRSQKIENVHNIDRAGAKLILADDSPTVRAGMGETLRSSGYTNFQYFENGKDAWDYLEWTYRETGDVSQVADLVISDVEMPRLDGLALTRKIKEHPHLKVIPVLLHSSIVTPDNLKKGQAVGADAQVSKPEMSRVVEFADKFLSAARSEKPISARSQIAAAAVPVENASNAKTPAAPPKAAIVHAPEPAAKGPLSKSGSGSGNGVAKNPLWATFMNEVSDRLPGLDQSLQQLAVNPEDTAAANEILRLLHTVKSAASIVPVNEVATITHELESVLEKNREQPQVWPLERLVEYHDWLSDLAHHASTPEETLAKAKDLHFTGA